MCSLIYHGITFYTCILNHIYAHKRCVYIYSFLSIKVGLMVVGPVFLGNLIALSSNTRLHPHIKKKKREKKEKRKKKKRKKTKRYLVVVIMNNRTPQS